MDVSKTIRVKPWGKDQGDFVEINADDFDPKVHQRFEAEGGASPSAPGLDPLDHDHNGAKGGSLKGAASTAAKGARRKPRRKSKN